MAENDSIQFILSPEYVDEEFSVLFAEQADSEQNAIPTDAQKIGLLLLAGLTQQQADYRDVVVRRQGADIVVTVSKSTQRR